MKPVYPFIVELNSFRSRFASYWGASPVRIKDPTDPATMFLDDPGPDPSDDEEEEDDDGDEEGEE